MEHLRRTLHVALALVAATLFALPVILVTLAGWFSSERLHPVSLERWTLLAVLYVLWGVVLLVGFVWTMDRLGARWHAHEGPPRSKRDRRRLRAALRLEEALAEQPRQSSSRRRRKDRA